MGADFKTKSEY